jgi:hypothetical protein
MSACRELGGGREGKKGSALNGGQPARRHRPRHGSKEEENRCVGWGEIRDSGEYFLPVHRSKIRQTVGLEAVQSYFTAVIKGRLGKKKLSPTMKIYGLDRLLSRSYGSKHERKRSPQHAGSASSLKLRIICRICVEFSGWSNQASLVMLLMLGLLEALGCRWNQKPVVPSAMDPTWWAMNIFSYVCVSLRCVVWRHMWST